LTAIAIEDRNVRRVTLTMTALATLVIELALAEPERSPWLCIATASALLVAPTLALAWFLGWRARARDEKPGCSAGDGLPPRAVVALLLFFSLPFAVAAGRQVFSGHHPILEDVLISAVMNLGLGLATLSHRTACARLSALITLFLVLIGASLGDGPLLRTLTGLYVVAGTIWLLLNYWNHVAFGTVDRGKPRLPASALGCVVGVIVVLGAVVAVGPTRVAVVLAGLTPTSGGTSWSDPEARSGVNDGDNEVSASKNPQSVGFTQSEVYLDTDRPSLYDMFNEMYGEPYKPTERQRALALAQQEIREQKERPSENLKAGREFALVRRKLASPSERPSERAAKALVYIQGPTPLHLRLAAYDRFDGRSWIEAPYSTFVCPLEQEGGSAWFRLVRSIDPIYAGTVTHRIKIGTLDSSPLPLPGHLVRFRVGSIDQADFFGWAQDGILRMVGRTVPTGTVLDS
jgi:hypothetical protein